MAEMVFGVTSEMFVNGGLSVACTLLAACARYASKIAADISSFRTQLAVNATVQAAINDRLVMHHEMLGDHDDRIRNIETRKIT